MFVYPTPKPALKTAISILVDGFGSSASVSAKMPRQLPSRFVRVTRAGGSRADLVTDSARILIECFGATPEVVEAMCGTADASMHNAIGTVVDSAVFVRGWDGVSGPTDHPHPDYLTVERWQMHGNLRVSTTTPG